MSNDLLLINKIAATDFELAFWVLRKSTKGTDEVSPCYIS